MVNTIDIARNNALIGKKINILLADRNSLTNKLEDLKTSRYYSSAEMNFDFINKLGSKSSCKHFYKRRFQDSSQSKFLGKEIVDQLNNYETKLIADALDLTITHLELKIELIDNILNKLNNEKSNNST